MKLQLSFFQLQDLADSPGLQNPSLNTAECITEGHEPNLTDKGRRAYIITTMWLSFIFSVFLGPWVATITVVSFKNFRAESSTMFSALIFVSVFLFLVEVGLFITAGVLLFAQSGGPIKCHILAILLIIPLSGLSFGCCFKPKTGNQDNQNNQNNNDNNNQNNQNNNDNNNQNNQNNNNNNNQNSPISPAARIVIYLLASMTCYHFCWIVIGVMMNALWGVSVVLLICVVIVVLVFIVSNFFEQLKKKYHKLAMLYLSLILPFLSLITLVILNGQSFFEKDTTDSIVKTVILSVITAVISWTVLPREGNGPANEPEGNGPGNEPEGNGPANEPEGNGPANVEREGNGPANEREGNGLPYVREDCASEALLQDTQV